MPVRRFTFFLGCSKLIVCLYNDVTPCDIMSVQTAPVPTSALDVNGKTKKKKKNYNKFICENKHFGFESNFLK